MATYIWRDGRFLLKPTEEAIDLPPGTQELQYVKRELENVLRNIAHDRAQHPLVGILRMRDPSLETPEVRAWLDATARQLQTEWEQAMWREIHPPGVLDEHLWQEASQWEAEQDG